MKRKDCKKENRYECKTQDLSKVADILNEIIISGQVNDTETSIEDSWVDIIDNYTSDYSEVQVPPYFPMINI